VVAFYLQSAGLGDFWYGRARLIGSDLFEQTAMNRSEDAMPDSGLMRRETREPLVRLFVEGLPIEREITLAALLNGTTCSPVRSVG